LLAVLVPERYVQMIDRGAEYGNDRIVMGSHYAMDVLGGRTLALYDMAHLFANDSSYLNLSVREATPISDFQGSVRKARSERTLSWKQLAVTPWINVRMRISGASANCGRALRDAS
jgi:hypothetical protein